MIIFLAKLYVSYKVLSCILYFFFVYITPLFGPHRGSMGDFKVFFGFFSNFKLSPVLGIPRACNLVGKLNSQIYEGHRCFEPNHLTIRGSMGNFMAFFVPFFQLQAFRPVLVDWVTVGPFNSQPRKQDFILYTSPTSLVVKVFPLDLLWKILPQQALWEYLPRQALWENLRQQSL